jgi:hypothetical protein
VKKSEEVVICCPITGAHTLCSNEECHRDYMTCKEKHDLSSEESWPELIDPNDYSFKYWLTDFASISYSDHSRKGE